MNLVLFTHPNSLKDGILLHSIVQHEFHGSPIELINNFDMLKSKLLNSAYQPDKEIFIILAESKNRLNQLTFFIELLESKRLVLIIPDNSEKTISTAVRFFPRFFTPVSDTYEDLCSVLNKMIK